MADKLPPLIGSGLDWQDFVRRRRIREAVRRSRRPSDLLAAQEQEWLARQASDALAEGRRKERETRQQYYRQRLTRPPER